MVKNIFFERELTWIKNYIRRNPNISLCELYGKLRVEKGYSRHACSLFRIVRKLKYPVNTEHHSKYTPKKYDTPTNIGIKWQMDVKVIPKQCYVGNLPDKFYQYTVIDEASRERFIYPYKEQSAKSTIDFVTRAIIFFGYIPKCIQTDNGQEFTYINKSKKHIFDIFCNKRLKILPRLKLYYPYRNDITIKSYFINKILFRLINIAIVFI